MMSYYSSEPIIPSSVFLNRKYVLETLGVIAKQMDTRRLVRRDSEETVGRSVSGAASSTPSTALVASDLRTVYDLGQLHSSQNEGTINALKFQTLFTFCS